MIEYITIIFVAFAGFSLAYYLFHKKRRKSEHLVCPMKGKCSEVINSEFSKFLGMPVEVLGMVYYLSIAVGYGVLVSFPEVLGGLAPYLLVVSVLAFFFSVYLTFIQLVTLKQICTWCLLSATFCTLIAIAAVLGSSAIAVPFLEENRNFFLTLHVLVMGLGLGAATLADVFFFKFLKDFRISENEADVLSTISDFIWFALGFILLSGLALFLPESTALLSSSKFLAKAIIVGVITVNGAFLTLKIAPRLMNISFGEKHEHHDGELVRSRKLAFTLGPISVVSWYSAFILGTLPRSFNWSLAQILGTYVILVFLAIFAARYYERCLSKKSQK